MRLPALLGLLLLPACGAVGPDNDDSRPRGRLVFVSQVVERDLQLFAANADGSGVTRLTNDAADYSGPDWSPDGQSIVFASTRGGNANFDLYVMRADGSNVRRIYGTEHAEFAPAWSPDGSRIAFQFKTSVTDGWDIYTVAADGSDLRRVTDTSLDEELPDWSPDGRIVYQAGKTNRNIYVCEADGSNRVQLTDFNNTVLGAPAWSPDGSRIAFESTLHQADAARGWGEYEIYVMGADGSGITRLTRLATPDRAARYPGWSGDSRFLVFQVDEAFDQVLAFRRRTWVVNADGANARELDTGRNARFPRLSSAP